MDHLVGILNLGHWDLFKPALARLDWYKPSSAVGFQLVVVNTSTLDHVLENPYPPSGNQVLRKLKENNGFLLKVNNESILTAMQRAEAPYYNSLMMLNLLLFSHRIDDDNYRRYYSALENFDRYSEAVWQFGTDIYTAVKKEI